MWKTIILVGLGGGVGSVLRYLVSTITTRHFPGLFPWGTLLVNIAGCLITGLLIGLFNRQHIYNEDFKYLLIIGFCGGFTTFSTFAAENMSLFHSGNHLTAFMYTVSSVTICLGATWIGMYLVIK